MGRPEIVPFLDWTTALSLRETDPFLMGLPGASCPEEKGNWVQEFLCGWNPEDNGRDWF